MARQILAILMVLVGVILVLVGINWNAIAPPKANWSPQQADEYTDAALALHSAAHAHEHDASEDSDERPEHDAEYQANRAAAQLRFDSIRQDLDEAIVTRDRTGLLVSVGGIILAASGLAVYVTRKPPR